MKRCMKAAFSAILALVIIMSVLPFSLSVSAVQGSQYTANQYIAGRLDLVFSEYPVGSYFTFDGKACDHHGTGTCSYFGGCNCRSNFYDTETGKTIKLNSIQCMGFAHYVFYRLFGFIDRSEYANDSQYYSLGEISKANMTAENCRSLLINASTGAHIRVEGHSMIYLSGNNDGLTVLHCNVDAKCGTSIRYFTWADFANSYKNRGVIYVHMPRLYPGLSDKSVVDTSSPYYYAGQSVVFNWTKKAGVTNYKLKIKSLTNSAKTAEFSSINGVTKTVTDSNLFIAGNTYVAEIYAGGATSADSSVSFYIAKSRSQPLGQTVKNGIYSLKNSKNGKYLTSPSSVSTAAFNNGANQLYYFEYVGDGLYKIHVGGLDSAKLLTVNSTSYGAVSSGSSFVVAEADKAKTNRQLFYVSKASNGYYIESIGNPGYVMNAASTAAVTVNAQSQAAYSVWNFCDSKGTAVDPSKVSAFIVGTYTITTESTSLNIRNGPGSNYTRVGSVAKGAKVEVTAIDGEWGYISSPAKGWICLENYTTFVSPLINAISVESAPKKTVYTIKQTLDTQGLSIKVSYSDGSSKIITTGFNCSYDFSTAGDAANGYKKTVVVTYSGKTTSFNVTVTGAGMPTEVLTELYTVNSKLGIISGITPGKTFDEFLGGFYNSNYIKVYSGNKAVDAGTKIATGMVLKLTDGSTVAQSLTVIVTGDVNGDGFADVSDILTIQSYILKKSTLTDIKLKAADCNGDGAVDVSDILTIQSHILGKSSIKPQKF